jgi:hypothetical protein
MERVGEFYNIPLYTDGLKYYGFIGWTPIEATTLNLLKIEIRDLLTETK